MSNDPLDSEFFFDAAPGERKGPRPLLRFYTEAVELPGKSAEEGRPVYEDRDFVGITNPGSRDEVVRLAKDKAKQDEYVAWAYRRWLTTKEQPIDGTPIETVPFVSKAVAMELKGLNIHTLEALATVSDNVVGRMMGLTDLKKKAGIYIEAAKDTAILSKLTHELEARDRKIADMERQITEMNTRFVEAMKERA